MHFSPKFERIRGRVSEALSLSQTTGPVAIAVAIGAGAGFASVLLRWLVELVTELFQHRLGGGIESAGGSVHSWVGMLWPVPVVALGGLLVGLMSRYLLSEAKGHGIPDVMEAVARRGGRIRGRVAVVKLVASALTIGSGGSAGREGPIVHIGSAFGSSVAQWLRLSDRMVILGVACGAAGGIAATFNAPMAGVLFALEVIVRRFTARYFGMVVVSAATATVVMRLLSNTGDYPKFPLLADYRMVSLADLSLFILMGVLCAGAALLFGRVLHAVERGAERLRVPAPLKPALGGAAVGLAAVATPQVMGSGYEAIGAALNNNLGGWLLLALCLSKITATALTVGSGGSGGVFVPLLFTGAMLGGAYGSLAHWLAPLATSSPGAYALVGMSAVFAAAAHAPITGIIMLIEMTDNYHIVLPLMSATVLATFISQRVSRDSVYTARLRDRGIEIQDTPEVNLMDSVTVAEAMDEVVDCVPVNMPVPQLMEKLGRDHERGYPVVDVDGNLAGIVTMRDVEETLLARDPAQLVVGDICTRSVAVCRPDQTLGAAVSQFGARNFGRLPVIDPDNPARIIGVLRRADVVNAYLDAWRRGAEMTSRNEELRAAGEAHRMVLEQSVVSCGAPLAGRQVREAGFPGAATLGAIRRGPETLVPRGDTLIQPGDLLVLLTTTDHAAEVRDWLRDNAR